MRVLRRQTWPQKSHRSSAGAGGGGPEAPQLADDPRARLSSLMRPRPAPSAVQFSISVGHLRPICTRESPAGSMRTAASDVAPGSATPSTSMRTISGAASSIAFSIASFMVIADEGQPWQLPSRRRNDHVVRDRRAARRRRRASRDRGGRLSSAAHDPLLELSGCRPWSSRRLATRSSAAKRPNSSPPGALVVDDLHHRGRGRRRRARAGAAPAPRRPRARGSLIARSSASSVSMRSPTGWAARVEIDRVRGLGVVGDRLIEAWRRGSASGASPGSCPRRGTCARRRAGRGRSCAPCA